MAGILLSISKEKKLDARNRNTFIGKYKGNNITARVVAAGYVPVEDKAISWGENILPYVGTFYGNGLRFEVHDNYWRTLKDLKEHFDTFPTLSLDDEYKTTVLKELLAAHGRPGEWGITILSDVLRGLQKLCDRSLLHGDLHVRNVVLQQKPSGKITAQLTGMKPTSMGSNLGTVALEGQAKAFVKVLKFTLGVDEEKYFSPEARDIINRLDRAPRRRFGWPLKKAQWEALQILTKQTFNNKPGSLVNHPLFWEDHRGLDFFCNASMLIQACKHYLKFHLEDEGEEFSAMRKFLRAIQRVYMGKSSRMVRNITANERCYQMKEENWQKIIKERYPGIFDETIAGEKGFNTILKGDKIPQYEFNKVYGTEVWCLLKYIRDLRSHQGEKGKETKKQLGSTRAFYDFFRELFPHLLIQVYRVVQCHLRKMEAVLGNCIFFDALKKDVAFI